MYSDRRWQNRTHTCWGGTFWSRTVASRIGAKGRAQSYQRNEIDLGVYTCQVWTEAANLWATARLALALSTPGFRPKASVSRVELLGMHHPATLYAGLRKQEWFEAYPLPERNHEQDPYCFRCAPQVHGAIWKEIRQCEEWVTEELTASTDNPLILTETSEFLHGGNFHAIYPARMLDRLTSAYGRSKSSGKRPGGLSASGHSLSAE